MPNFSRASTRRQQGQPSGTSTHVSPIDRLIASLERTGGDEHDLVDRVYLASFFDTQYRRAEARSAVVEYEMWMCGLYTTINNIVATEIPGLAATPLDLIEHYYGPTLRWLLKLCKTFDKAAAACNKQKEIIKETDDYIADFYRHANSNARDFERFEPLPSFLFP